MKYLIKKVIGQGTDIEVIEIIDSQFANGFLRVSYKADDIRQWTAEVIPETHSIFCVVNEGDTPIDYILLAELSKIAALPCMSGECGD